MIKMLMVCENPLNNWIAMGTTRGDARMEAQDSIKSGKFAKPLYAVVVIPKKRPTFLLGRRGS